MAGEVPPCHVAVPALWTVWAGVSPQVTCTVPPSCSVNINFPGGQGACPRLPEEREEGDPP